MKKRGVILVAVMFVFALTAPVFAAPVDIFADVPAKHWAYASIQQLAKAGIIEGYGDGTFRGDRTMTRYEMAIIVGNAMTKLNKADAQQKAIIEKLAQEYSNELASLSARVAKVEAKSKINFLFDNRLGFNTTSLGPTDGGGLLGNINGKNQFAERIRIYMTVPVGDVWQWNARAEQHKWNFTQPSADSAFRFDRYWVSGDIFGGKVELGKNWLYPGKGAFYGNTGDTDSFMYSFYNADKSLWVRMGTGHSGTLLEPTVPRDLNFVEFIYKPTRTSDIGAFWLKQDGAGAIQDYNLYSINGAMEINTESGLAVAFEYAKNKAKEAAYNGKSGWWVSLNSKYKATSQNPGLYTQMVNPWVQGDHGWGLSYRHLPTGVAGQLNRNAFNGWTPLSTDSISPVGFQNAVNDVNAIRFDYLYVPWKNVQLTLTYDHIKPINGSWVNNSFQTTFNFFF